MSTCGKCGQSKLVCSDPNCPSPEVAAPVSQPASWENTLISACLLLPKDNSPISKQNLIRVLCNSLGIQHPLFSVQTLQPKESQSVKCSCIPGCPSEDCMSGCCPCCRKEEQFQRGRRIHWAIKRLDDKMNRIEQQLITEKNNRSQGHDHLKQRIKDLESSIAKPVEVYRCKYNCGKYFATVAETGVHENFNCELRISRVKRPSGCLFPAVNVNNTFCNIYGCYGCNWITPPERQEFPF